MYHCFCSQSVPDSLVLSAEGQDKLSAALGSQESLPAQTTDWVPPSMSGLVMSGTWRQGGRPESPFVSNRLEIFGF